MLKKKQEEIQADYREYEGRIIVVDKQMNLLTYNRAALKLLDIDKSPLKNADGL